MTNYLSTNAAFALKVKDLHDLLATQIGDAMDQSGMIIPSKTSAIVELLFENDSLSKADISKELSFSHQLCTQRLAWLEKHQMVSVKEDPNDRRRQIIQLTEAGKFEARKLRAFLPRLQQAYESLFSELGLNLDDVLQRASFALEQDSLVARISRNSQHKVSAE